MEWIILGLLAIAILPKFFGAIFKTLGWVLIIALILIAIATLFPIPFLVVVGLLTGA